MPQLPLTGLALPLDLPKAQETHALRAYPDVPSAVLSSHAKFLGVAGELLVDSLLMRLGYVCLPLPDMFPVDRLLLHPARTLGIQVKTCTRAARDGSYRFEIQHGYSRSPGGVRPYRPGAYDLLALVVLPLNAVLFSAETAHRQQIDAREIPALQRSPGRSLDTALAALGLGPEPQDDTGALPAPSSQHPTL